MKVLKCLAVILAVTGLLAVSVNATPAPPVDKNVAEATGVRDQPQARTGVPGVRDLGNNCGDPFDAGTLYAGNTAIAVSTIGFTDDFTVDGAGTCGWAGYSDGYEDGILTFQVAVDGTWTFAACDGDDCNMELRSTDPCPGTTLVYLDDDSCPGPVGNCAAPYGAFISADLVTGVDYYIILDYYVGNLVANGPCADDSDCDDGLFCNGAETCVAFACVLGTNPCEVYQACDEDNDVCVNPDPCISYLCDAESGYYWTGGVNNWSADDIFPDAVGGSTLESYDLLVICRDDELNTFDMDTQLYYFLGLCDISGTPCQVDADCPLYPGDPLDICSLYYEPGDVIPGTECSFTGLECGSGTYPMVTCNATGTVTLPDLYWVGYNAMGTPGVIGFLITGPARVGFSDDLWAIHDGAAWGLAWFGGSPWASFEVSVCTTEVGPCCLPDGTCQRVEEADCVAMGGTWTMSTLWNPVDCSDIDGDGIDDSDVCGNQDNCPGVVNPGQEDCDAGTTPEGDACELDPYYMDTDADGACDCNADPAIDGAPCDDCDTDPDKTEPMQCGCGELETDTDGDGTADCNDNCPNDPNKIEPGQCGCGNPDTDSDGDGVADCCDACPDGEWDPDFEPTVCVDPAGFQGCGDAIPAVSEWGLVILALLLLVAGKVYFSRRTAKA